MREIFAGLTIFFMWLLHWLPLPLQAAIGNVLGTLLYALAGRRRRIVHTNLRLCFPELGARERGQLARRHVRLVMRCFLEHGLLWWASEARLRRLIRCEGFDNLQRELDAGQAVVMLAPHFIGLDQGGAGFSMHFQGSAMYAHQKIRLLDALVLRGRQRFNAPLLLARQDGLRAAVKAIRKGLPFYYLPDMDYGAETAVFVPFFGVPAATTTGLSRLVQLAHAKVIPLVTEVLPWGRGYVVRMEPAWTDFPTPDVEADTRRMNAWLESRIRPMPQQYYWVHRRFKTRPPGEPRIY
ncbi:lipid A biosynthesis acyltransferase [uncultured Ramlibacter sp.]|uniref:LpxL/LpxP family acyltransferase n=1 Tax=uncultured Ramlibacter sp. TaxID=260755 RepID=UPI00261F224C|nr:lipid A biosynthesis acyltransferase [uncultured Ramlibacter sp.]